MPTVYWGSPEFNPFSTLLIPPTCILTHIHNLHGHSHINTHTRHLGQEHWRRRRMRTYLLRRVWLPIMPPLHRREMLPWRQSLDGQVQMLIQVHWYWESTDDIIVLVWWLAAAMWCILSKNVFLRSALICAQQQCNHLIGCPERKHTPLYIGQLHVVRWCVCVCLTFQTPGIWLALWKPKTPSSLQRCVVTTAL